MSDAVAPAVERIRAWGEERNWRGFDPYDALNSPAAPVLTLGTRMGRRVLTQIVKRSPINLRPLLGIRPDWNAKAIGLIASGYARLAAAGDATARGGAERWLDWLAANHSGDEAGLAWGYHFDVQTRFFRYAKGTPNAIATSFVAQAFLDGASLLGDERWRDTAESAARFLESHLLDDGAQGPYFRYLPGEDELVHNANLLACAVCARAGRPDSARRALVTSLRAQREDGSWPYSEGPQGRWVDNFHTGYVLESLALCRELHPDVANSLARGLDYWSRTMFLPNGTPRYTPDSLYPVDAHCYATAVDTWFAAGDLAQAERLATQLVSKMLDRAGYVHFQQNRFWTNRVPFVRWTTAPTFKALAGVLMGRAHLD